MRLYGINNIDPEEQSITVTVQIFLSWRDDRIERPENRSVNISPDLFYKFWNPDIYVSDLRNFKVLKNIGALQGGIVISPKGQDDKGHNKTEVLYYFEAEIKFTCPINYKAFPFHKAICKVR